MGRVSTGADALIEILELCEQTLTAICLPEDVSVRHQAADKPSQSRQHMRANVARRFILIQGGLPGNLQHPNAR
jgi:hypothetical protein